MTESSRNAAISVAGDRVRKLRVFVDGYARLIGAVALGALVLALLSFVFGQSFWPDHEVYRRAVHAWLAGEDFMPGSGPITNSEPLPWVYPPFALLPLLPLGVLPLKAGITLLFTANLAAMVATFYLVTRHVWQSLSKPGALALALVATRGALLLEPVAGCFHQGQINIVLMGMVAVDCLARHPRWPRGLLVGLAAAIKLMPAAFVLLFLVRRDLRAVLTTVATAVTATLVGFAVDVEASVKYWFIQGPAASASGSPLRSNQSVMAVLARFELPHVVQFGIWIGLCLLLTAVALPSLRRLEMPMAMAATGVLTLLVSPTSWANHWVWVAPALLLMFGYALRRRSAVWFCAAAVTTVVVKAAPFVVLSMNRADMLSLDPLGHLRAASYVLVGVAVLVLLLFHALRTNRTAPPAAGGADPVRQPA